MKKRRTIYIVIAVVLIIINLLADIFEKQQDYFNVGYFIGSHLFIIIGIVLLRLAYKLTQRIKAIENRALDNSITNIGSSQSSGE